MSMRRTAASLATVAALGVGGVALAAPASAQPVVTGGLVNVTLVDVLSGNDVAVQVPIGVAANVCGLSVAAVLAAAANGPVTCEGTVGQLPVAFQPR